MSPETPLIPELAVPREWALWPLRKCEPWCRDGNGNGHGHGAEHPVDRRCSSQGFGIDLSLWSPSKLTTDEEGRTVWGLDRVELNLRRDPEHSEPVVMFAHEDSATEHPLTLLEARQLLRSLTALLDLAENG